MRGAAMVAATTTIAVTGASLVYVYFTGPPEPTPPPLPVAPRNLSPPPDLPATSKLLIPNMNLNFNLSEPEPDFRPQCDYGPLWECIVNGNGGCEALEEDLRNCLERARKPEPYATSQCNYGPLWECIVNGNGGCEVLEEDVRNCLKRTRNYRRS